MDTKSISLWRKVFLQVSGMAFFFMSAGTNYMSKNYMSLALSVISMAVLLIIIVKCPKVFSHKPRWNSIIVGVFITFMAVRSFKSDWSRSRKVEAIASILNFSSDEFLTILFLCGSILSVFFSVRLCALFFNCRAKEEDKVLCLFSHSKKTGIHSLYYSDWIFCMLIACCAAINFTTFPLKNALPATDSSVFLYIGRRMHAGYVPYTDLFDHKGLLLYFYQYLAWCISSKPYVGIWIIEYINIFATTILLLITAKLFTDNQSVPYICVIIMLSIFGFNIWEGGNLSEEYALPWLTLSLFIFMKYFKTDRFKIWEISLLGVSFVAVLMLRVNMVSTWVAFIPLILIKMLRQKEWKNLGKAALGFLLGIGIAALPFLIYMIRHNNLEAMWNYYVRFNLFYSGEISSTSSRIYTAWNLFIRLGWMAVFAYLFSLSIFYKNRTCLLNIWYAVVSFLLVNLSGYAYGHYDIIMLPTLVIPLTLIVDVFIEEISPVLFTKSVLVQKSWISVGVCLLLVITSCLSYRGKEPDSELVTYLKDKTTESEDVLIIGNNCTSYLESNRFTKNKFFYHTPPVNYSDDLYSEFQNAAKANPSDVIVVLGSRSAEEQSITNIGTYIKGIDAQYQAGSFELEEYESFYVYRRVK